MSEGNPTRPLLVTRVLGSQRPRIPTPSPKQLLVQTALFLLGWQCPSDSHWPRVAAEHLEGCQATAGLFILFNFSSFKSRS